MAGMSRANQASVTRLVEAGADIEVIINSIYGVDINHFIIEK